MARNEETKTEESMISDVKDCTEAFEEALAKKGDGKYVLRLYVGYFCTKPRNGILRNDKYIISNIFKLFSGS